MHIGSPEERFHVQTGVKHSIGNDGPLSSAFVATHSPLAFVSYTLIEHRGIVFPAGMFRCNFYLL